MTVYTFMGTVRPERASLSLPPFEVEVLVDGMAATRFKVSIIRNHIYAQVESDSHDYFTLRNNLEDIIVEHLSIFGFLLGLTHDVEISRCVNDERGIDWVFGTDIPCLAGRTPPEQLVARAREIMGATYIRRCLRDLSRAIRYARDTGFFCYRAVECLRQHFVRVRGLEAEDRAIQWSTFREAIGVGREEIDSLMPFAVGARHGELSPISDSDRQKVFMTTWDIVERYFQFMVKRGKQEQERAGAPPTARQSSNRP